MIYLGAALAEIFACIAFWMWSRRGRSIGWLVACMVSLLLLAALFTQSPPDVAWRSVWISGALYVVAGIGWKWLVERRRLEQRELIGGGLCLCAIAMILLAPYGA